MLLCLCTESEQLDKQMEARFLTADVEVRREAGEGGLQDPCANGKELRDQYELILT